MRKLKKVAIYQIKENASDKHDKIFKPYEWVKTKFGAVDMDDYCCVYCGNRIVDGLDDIFTEFNVNPKPMGYRGHSLSVSDIVEVDGKRWYCDIIGWEEV